jgi:hypothetical protein
MKYARWMGLAFALVFVAALSLQADDKGKEVKLTGTLVCPKCALKESGVTDCGNALQVKKDGKTEVYYLKDKGKGEKYHACTKPKDNVTVTGTLKEEKGKKIIENPMVKAE